MRREFYAVFGGLLCVGFAPALASSTLYGDGGAALQTVLNHITKAPHAGISSVNVLTDPIPEGMDAYWHITASGGSIATVVVQLASGANASAFGVYDALNPNRRVPLLSGSATAGGKSLLSISDDGSIWVNFADTGVDFSTGSFGYYLDTHQPSGGGNLWYSDAILNGGEDHMVVMRGLGTDTIQLPPWPAWRWTPGEYLLAFEDLPLASSRDYADFVVMIESIYSLTPPTDGTQPPVPVPGAAWLGMVGVGVIHLVRRKFA